MSIAELIMQGTNRASESTAWVGDSLAKLGQNVGKALADREQQKQAQEMLPMFQQSMQDAMILANKGDAGLAYSKLMPFITNPATANNPYTFPAIKNVLTLIESAAQQSARNMQVEAYRNRYSGGGGGFEMPTFEDMATWGTRGGLPATNAQDSTQENQQFDPNVGGLSSEMIDEENAQNLPTDEERGFSAGIKQDNPFEFGFKTGERSLYVADEASRNKAVEAMQAYEVKSPDQKAEVFDSTIDTSNQPPANSIPVNIPGYGRGRLKGPSMEAEQEVTGITQEQTFSEKSGAGMFRRQESKPKLSESQKAWEAFSQNIGVASSMFNQNQQLRKIMEMAGGDTTQITTDDDVIIDEDGRRVPVKRVFVKGQDAGELSNERPMGADGKPDPRSMSEAEAVKTIIDAPGFIDRFGWKFYPEKAEQPTAEAPAPTQAGIPANQITTPAPEIPEEAMALQKIVEQGQTAKAGETAKNVEKRIQDIDAQIKRLGSPTIERGGRLASEGNIPARSKTSEEAQADIQKITNLKTERELLFAKTEKAYNTAKSEGRVFQNAEEVKSSKKKFPAGTIIYIGTTPAKVK